MVRGDSIHSAKRHASCFMVFIIEIFKKYALRSTRRPRSLIFPMNELELYRENVERLAELNSSEVFSNGKAEHAAIIYETFFKFSKENIVIFCRDLSAEVFDSELLLNLAENALRRKIRVAKIGPFY
jgi:hypothetical protein